MTVILTGDIHLNDKPEDEYRWGLLNWLFTNHKADELVIAGDLTDAKDKHSAKLVNRLFRAMLQLQEKYKVIILKGNHDYFEPQHPFFEFIGSHPNIQYIKAPEVIDLSIGKATFIPAGVKWNFKLHSFPFVFTHATFNGAQAENGTSLTGVDPSVLDDYEGTVYSGDVHVPQELFRGKLIYIGAPYHIRFGDNYRPRLLLLDEHGDKNLYYPAPKKLTFYINKPEDLYKEKISKGDYVKVKCYLSRANYLSWKEYKEQIQFISEEGEWLLHGVEWLPLEAGKREELAVEAVIDPVTLIETYAKRHKMSEEYITIGKELALKLP